MWLSSFSLCMLIVSVDKLNVNVYNICIILLVR